MRGLIFAVVVLLAGTAHALDFAQPMINGVTSTMTVSAINISSGVATSVIVSTQALYRQVCVQNLDNLSFLSCGETVNVSTIQANNLYGVYLPTATATTLANPYPCFEVVPGKDFFCRSAASSPSRAVITRKR